MLDPQRVVWRPPQDIIQLINNHSVIFGQVCCFDRTLFKDTSKHDVIISLTRETSNFVIQPRGPYLILRRGLKHIHGDII